MQNWIIDIMGHYGYFGIAFLIAAENVFPPIPSEIILTFGGFMTTYAGLDPWVTSFAATAGSLVGALILYGVGRLLPTQKLQALLLRWGRVLGTKPEDLENADRRFAQRGGITVFLCRFVPIVRSLISIPAGMAKMPLGKFLLYTACGTEIWNVVLIFVGRALGSGWEQIDGYMAEYKYAVLGIAGVVGLAAGAWLLWHKKRTHK